MAEPTGIIEIGAAIKGVRRVTKDGEFICNVTKLLNGKWGGFREQAFTVQPLCRDVIAVFNTQ